VLNFRHFSMRLPPLVRHCCRPCTNTLNRLPPCDCIIHRFRRCLWRLFLVFGLLLFFILHGCGWWVLCTKIESMYVHLP